MFINKTDDMVNEVFMIYLYDCQKNDLINLLIQPDNFNDHHDQEVTF